MTLFIGMPVFNRERFIEDAINSIINQSYKDWVLFISDNNSTDRTLEIIKSFSTIDNITYHSQSRNVGLEENHNFLAVEFLKSNCNYFMWAQSDDLYNPNYLSKLFDGIKATGKKIAFSNMVNIDAYCNTIRLYEDNLRFVNKNKLRRLIKFVSEPEVSGKSNIYHSVFHRSIIRDFYSKSSFKFLWSDNVIAYFALMKSDIYIERKILFFKRNASSSDIKNYTPPKIIKYEFLQTLPITSYVKFISEVRKMGFSDSEELISFIMIIIKIPIILINSFISKMLFILKHKWIKRPNKRL